MCPCLCSSTAATSSFLSYLPKAELHAHLTGSVPISAVQTLLHRYPLPPDLHASAVQLLSSSSRSLAEGFALFPLLHQLIPTASALQYVVQSVIASFASESVIYLELRTTPRSTDHLSTLQYLLVILRQLIDVEFPVTRLLVSISRHLPLSHAHEILDTVRHVLREHPNLAHLIVGVELSGHPAKGLWTDFQPLLAKFREETGLPVALHFAEVHNEIESMGMIAFGPDRLGHAVCMSQKVADAVVQSGVAIEVCLTSNVKTMSVSSINQHPVFKCFIPNDVPFCICTDDAGVFDTSLTKEYDIFKTQTNATKLQIAKVALTGLTMTFCREQSVLQQVFKQFYRKLEDLACGEQCQLLRVRGNVKELV